MSDKPETSNSVGNWRDHILVNCAECNKLMGYHKKSTTAICNDCLRVEVKECTS